MDGMARALCVLKLDLSGILFQLVRGFNDPLQDTDKVIPHSLAKILVKRSSLAPELFLSHLHVIEGYEDAYSSYGYLDLYQMR